MNILLIILVVVISVLLMWNRLKEVVMSDITVSPSHNIPADDCQLATDDIKMIRGIESETGRISTEVQVSMAALLALDDLENGRIEEAKITLSFLTEILGIGDLQKHLHKRLRLNG